MTEPSQRRRAGTRTAGPWGPLRVVLIVGGVVVALAALGGGGPWFPLVGMTTPTRIPTFGAACVVLALGLQGAFRALATGRRAAVWAWSLSTLAVIAAGLAGLGVLGDTLPRELHLHLPRAAVLALGVVLVIWGLSRDSDVIHEREGAHDWFSLVERLLRSDRQWTWDQAARQVEGARAEFERAQSRRSPGSAELHPGDLFGTPEEYVASLTTRPSPVADPLVAGRWYYLSMGMVLGVWAAFRAVSGPMGWLTLLLFLLAVVSLLLFVWASLRLRRRR